MNDLQRIFDYQGRQVRTFIVDDEPYFIVKDVCDVLTLTNPTEAIRGLDDDEKTTLRISEGGPEVNAVNEAGLYSLIMRSNKPEAKQFKRWITHEVLPSIRKTGTYSVKPMSQLEILAQATQLLLAQEQSIKEIAATQAAHDDELLRIGHRIDSLDACNVNGDLQQRLNAMIRKYAQKAGVMYNIAWREFIVAYNNAFRTNLTLKIDHYREKHGLKSLTTPQYLSLTDRLEDAVRVADKLLNKVTA